MIGSKFNEAYLQIIKEDYDTEMNNVPAETEADEKSLKRVTFLTSDEVLIDALNSGVEEVVLFTNAKDETTGEDTVVEVKIGKDSFGELAIEDEVEADEEDTEVTEEDEMTAEDTENVEGGDEGSVEGEDTDIEENVEGGDEGSVEGEDTDIEEDADIEEDIAVECDEWLEDGVCVKCQSPECDGSCKCEKCGEVNCIGDCQ
jgi:hypothetical protein